MAHRWIGRDEDDYWKNLSKYSATPTPTDTDDEDGSPESSISDDHSLTTPAIPHMGATPIPTPATSTYPSEMSYPQIQSTDTDHRGPPPEVTARPSDNSNRPFRPPSGYGPPSTWMTSYSKTQAYPDHNGLKTTTTPTPTPVSETASPKPTDDDFSLQNHGADGGSNKTTIYAAGGVVPIVVIILVFLIFFCLRKRRRQRQAAAVHSNIEEMKMQPKPVERPYFAPITPPSPPPQAALPQYSPSTTSLSHPPTASSSQPVILGPIPSGNNGAYLTGMDTSDLVSMRSGGVSRQGTVVDRDPFADGRSLEEAPPPYRPSSLPPASLASTSRNSSVRMSAPLHMTSQTQLIERSPFDDPDDDDVSDTSEPILNRDTDAMSDVSELSYQIDPVVGRSPF